MLASRIPDWCKLVRRLFWANPTRRRTARDGAVRRGGGWACMCGAGGRSVAEATCTVLLRERVALPPLPHPQGRSTRKSHFKSSVLLRHVLTVTTTTNPRAHELHSTQHRATRPPWSSSVRCSTHPIFQ